MNFYRLLFPMPVHFNWIGEAIMAGASLLGGFTDNKANQAMTREQMAWQEAQNAKKYQVATADAKKAGLHPLFALGGNPGVPSPVSTVGSSMGSAMADAGRAVGQGVQNYQNRKAQKDSLAANSVYQRRLQEQTLRNNDLKNLQLSMQISEMGNDRNGLPAIPTGSAFDIDAADDLINPKAQELKKGEVMAHNRRHPEQNLNRMAPVTTVNMGSQKIKIPVEEVDTFFDDPVMVGGATFFYHANKDVDWAQVVNEWTGRKLTPKEATEGSRDMFKRLGLIMKRKSRHKRVSKYAKDRGIKNRRNKR